MDQNKGKVKLDDELLDQVSGGCGEDDFCAWNPDSSGLHEWIQLEWADGSLYSECRWCQLRKE